MQVMKPVEFNYWRGTQPNKSVEQMVESNVDKIIQQTISKGSKDNTGFSRHEIVSGAVKLQFATDGESLLVEVMPNRF